MNMEYFEDRTYFRYFGLLICISYANICIFRGFQNTYDKYYHATHLTQID